MHCKKCSHHKPQLDMATPHEPIQFSHVPLSLMDRHAPVSYRSVLSALWAMLMEPCGIDSGSFWLVKCFWVLSTSSHVNVILWYHQVTFNWTNIPHVAKFIYLVIFLWAHYERSGYKHMFSFVSRKYWGSEFLDHGRRCYIYITAYKKLPVSKGVVPIYILLSISNVWKLHCSKFNRKWHCQSSPVLNCHSALYLFICVHACVGTNMPQHICQRTTCWCWFSAPCSGTWDWTLIYQGWQQVL